MGLEELARQRLKQWLREAAEKNSEESTSPSVGAGGDHRGMGMATNDARRGAELEHLSQRIDDERLGRSRSGGHTGLQRTPREKALETQRRLLRADEDR
jgi:hypothetical protein